MRSTAFCDITQPRVVILYWRFGTTYWSHFQGASWPLKTGPIGCPETLVKNYHSRLCNIPEQHRSQELYIVSTPCFNFSWAERTQLSLLLSTAHVHASTTLLLLTVRNYDEGGFGCNGIMFIPHYMQIRQVAQNLRVHTDNIVSAMPISFPFQAKQAKNFWLPSSLTRSPI
jgi:hypothetical protein